MIKEFFQSGHEITESIRKKCIKKEAEAFVKNAQFLLEDVWETEYDLEVYEQIALWRLMAAQLANNDPTYQNHKREVEMLLDTLPNNCLGRIIRHGLKRNQDWLAKREQVVQHLQDVAEQSLDSVENGQTLKRLSILVTATWYKNIENHHEAHEAVKRVVSNFE